MVVGEQGSHSERRTRPFFVCLGMTQGAGRYVRDFLPVAIFGEGDSCSQKKKREVLFANRGEKKSTECKGRFAERERIICASL